MVHKTLEHHIKKICANSNCRKQRNGEPLESSWNGHKHYVSWKCEECGTKSWWETEHMSSGMRHKEL